MCIPSRKQVIRIRDVTFDEKTYYQLHNVDAARLVQEQEPHPAIQILQEIAESLLAHNQDEQELGIPSTNDATTTPPTVDKHPDQAKTRATAIHLTNTI